MNIYEHCPVITTEHLTLRLVRREDAGGLLKVYSDVRARPFFNADNCTSDFCYDRLSEMVACVNMWMWSYENGYFVRWTILHGEAPVGTVEMFRRDDGEDGRAAGCCALTWAAGMNGSASLTSCCRCCCRSATRASGVRRC